MRVLRGKPAHGRARLATVDRQVPSRQEGRALCRSRTRGPRAIRGVPRGTRAVLDHSQMRLRTLQYGWMHELETCAEPILAPLIQGQRQTWHEWRQAIAATWAFKTSIMIEQAAEEELRAIPSEMYPGFRKWQRPPLMNTQVWAGAYTGEPPHFYGRGQMRLMLTTPDGVSVPNDLTAYDACLQIGALVFRLFGHLIREGPRNAPQGDIARCLVPIWPVSPSAEWPPELSVNDDEMEILVKSMGDIPPAEPIRPTP